MNKPSQLTVQAADIKAFAAAHGMTPTGDPDEFWFQDEAGVYVAIVVFESAAAHDTWIGTIYTHPERSPSDIASAVRRRISRTDPVLA
ncbi:MAG: hypothetical protein H6525_12210 [Actinobacteria bacterium]|nr:hypothetical protein [Actinomycetota bacterium]